MAMFARVLLTFGCIGSVLATYDGFITPYETANIIRAQSYVSETHGVMTTDGYLLEMHRIPYKRNQTSGAANRPVVFLMHGLLAASHSFIMLGPEYAIAYNLADAGFDVWMGNARGTRNSRQHITLDPDSREDRSKFFDFTWEQIGVTDVANMIDYILNKTSNEKLHYIGHSQGGTAFMVLNSMRTEYNDKIISAHLLAGVGYMNYFPNRLLRSLATFTNTIYALAMRMNVVELFPPGTVSNSSEPELRSGPELLVQLIGGDDNQTRGEHYDYSCDKDEVCRSVDFCTGLVKQKEMCELFGLEEIMSEKIYDNILTEFEVGGAALKQIAHYGQNIQDQVFRRWNYGSMENFLTYGTYEPPIYDISLITINTTMHYTVNDNLLDERDVLAMCEVIPNCVVRKVARESFEHADFVAAGDVKELVTDYMIEQMLGVHEQYLLEQGQQIPEADNFPSTSTHLSAKEHFLVINLSMAMLYLCIV